MSYIKMNAKFSSKCSETKTPIKKGDPILYCTDSKKAFSAESLVYETYISKATEPKVKAQNIPNQYNQSNRLGYYNNRYISDIYSDASGREYYQNRHGRCEDAPCCGCCNY